MAYSELVKSFERIRDYVREFYVYGFRTRGQYDKKSLRSYDNERRRLESWLGDYIGSHRTAGGKNMFLSIDSRSTGSSPLNRVLKSKSFTDGDITLHFILFDILSESDGIPLSELTERVDGYLCGFDSPMSFEDSTVRKKLAEYIKLGLVIAEKSGRQTLYRKAPQRDLKRWREALEFFSEAGMCGVLGSFLLDKQGGGSELFTFKHHYVTHVLESEVLCSLLLAIHDRRSVGFSYYRRKHRDWSDLSGVPLKIFVSVQTGRRWVVMSNPLNGRLESYRLDYLRDVTLRGECPQYDALCDRLCAARKTMWGISFVPHSRAERVSFTIRIGSGEEYLWLKLQREKRCGSVERTDENTAVFTAEVNDSGELVPWVRSFIGNIVSLDFSNKAVEKKLRDDMNLMYSIYCVEDDNAVS